MSGYFSHVEPPASQRLSTDEFVLRPIVVADAELDYAAVMESREYLRPWEQTGWPADDFTLEEDRADVVSLEERHVARRAFSFTVRSPDETECLGCVYLMPPDATSFTAATVTAMGDRSWSEVGAALYFWVRTSRLGGGLDDRLLDAVRAWLARDWTLGELVVVTNEEVPQQVATIERAGLELAFRLDRAGQSGAYLAYV